MPRRTQTSGESEASRDPTAAEDPWRRWRIAAVVALMLLAASASLTKIWNFDMFWQLAGGEWMLQHKAVLRHDPFSSEATGEWVNIHWGFQLLVAVTYAVGGFVLLSVLKCAIVTATMGTFAWGLRRRVSPGWLMVAGVALLAVLSERIRLRPELLTCLFVVLVILLVERVRLGGSPTRLWWLVPIMLVWVNVHGLYFFGLGIIWSSVLGAWLDGKRRRTEVGGPGLAPARADAPAASDLLDGRAIGPMLAATVACLISPWPVKAAAHPFLLWTRVSGEAAVYTYGVAELQPTWQALGKHMPAVIVVLLVLWSLFANRRRVPIAHMLWLAAFVSIGLLARRNVGLIAPACAYLLAVHGHQWLRDRRPARRWLAPAATWAAAAAVVLLTLGYVTETVHRLRESTERFGPGLLEQNFPISTAKFLAGIEGGGDVLCENFGDAAVFIYYTSAKHKVWMDGRLEVHSLQRFAEQTRIHNDLRTVASAQWCDLPASVRFIVVSHQDTEQLSAMMEAGRFRLIQVCPSASCFECKDWAGPRAQGEAKVAANLPEFDRPLTDEGLIEGFPAEPRRWFRQNPAPRTYWMGAQWLWLGRLDSSEKPSEDPLHRYCTLLATRYLTAAKTMGLVPPEIATGMLAWAHHQRALQWPVAVSPQTPVDPNMARALHLYGQLAPSRLGTEALQTLAYRHVHALVAARQFDVADQVVQDLLAHLPPGRRVNPPRDYLKVRGTIAHALQMPEVGRILGRIRALRAAGSGASPAQRRRLGDLLLRRGKAGEARDVYRTLDADADVKLRLALCDWTEGRLGPARAALADLVKAQHPSAGYYLAVLLEHVGLYEQAGGAAMPAPGASDAVRELLTRLRSRLAFIRSAKR